MNALMLSFQIPAPEIAISLGNSGRGGSKQRKNGGVSLSHRMYDMPMILNGETDFGAFRRRMIGGGYGSLFIGCGGLLQLLFLYGLYLWPFGNRAGTHPIVRTSLRQIDG